MNIIIVEDEGIMALFLKESLEDLEHDVIGIFNNSNDLFEFMETSPKVDLILMDILIRGKMDGIEVSNIIRQKYMNISLIFITSYKDSETILSAKMASPQGYLIKPITKHELEAALMIVNVNKNIIQNKKTDLINIATYTYNKKKKTLYEEEDLIKLSNKELICLDLLIQNKNNYVSKEQLILSIWEDDIHSSNSLRELIYRIRKKLPEIKIVSNLSIGYCLLER